MLPIFRLIPVGGVLLAIAILLLALNPPRATSPSARADLVPARGALLNRADHPEWRQFLILAALRRAGEVERLRDLHDTVIRTTLPPPEAATPEPTAAKPEIAAPAPAVAEPVAEPRDAAPNVAEPAPATDEPKAVDVALADAKPEIEAKSEITEPAIEPAPAAAELKVPDVTPVAVEPKIAKATQSEASLEAAAPEPIAAEPKISEAAPAEAKSEITEPKTKPAPATAELNIPEAAPVAVEPKIAEATPAEANLEAAASEPVAAESKVSEAAPAETAPAKAKPDVAETKPMAAAPMVVAAAPIAAASPLPPETKSLEIKSLETNGSRAGLETTPPATIPVAPAPAPIKLAALPAQPVRNDDDITGSIEQADGDHTMPVGIGEASSSELPVMLPRERPPVLREMDIHRARQSKARPVRRSVHHRSRTRTSRTKTNAAGPRQLDLFALIFQQFAADVATGPTTPRIPYRWEQDPTME